MGVATSVVDGGQSLNFAIPAEMVLALVRETQSAEGLARGRKPLSRA